jgi:hypothetical protein
MICAAYNMSTRRFGLVLYVPTTNRPNVVTCRVKTINNVGNQLRFVEDNDVFWEWTALEKKNVFEIEPDVFRKQKNCSAEEYMQTMLKKFDDTKKEFKTRPPMGFLKGLEGLTLKYRILKQVVEEAIHEHDKYAKPHSSDSIPST